MDEPIDSIPRLDALNYGWSEERENLSVWRRKNGPDPAIPREDPALGHARLRPELKPKHLHRMEQVLKSLGRLSSERWAHHRSHSRNQVFVFYLRNNRSGMSKHPFGRRHWWIAVNKMNDDDCVRVAKWWRSLLAWSPRKIITPLKCFRRQRGLSLFH